MNLQPTKHDKKADMKICTYVDDVMKLICEKLGIIVPDYTGPHALLQSVHTKPDEADIGVVLKDSSFLWSKPYSAQELLVGGSGLGVMPVSEVKDEVCDVKLKQNVKDGKTEPSENVVEKTLSDIEKVQGSKFEVKDKMLKRESFQTNSCNEQCQLPHDNKDSVQDSDTTGEEPECKKPKVEIEVSNGFTDKDESVASNGGL